MRRISVVPSVGSPGCCAIVTGVGTVRPLCTRLPAGLTTPKSAVRPAGAPDALRRELGARRLAVGQEHEERRPAAIPTLEPDLAAVGLDDALADREPEPGALALRGEEGVEQPRLHVRRDAGALVLDLDLAPARAGSRRDAYDPAGRHRFRRIVEKIQDDLLDLPGVHEERGHRAQVRPDVHPAAPRRPE